MTTKQRIAFWFVFFVAIFSIAYTATDLIVKNVMASYVPPTEPKYTQWLEIKDNYGTQTDQYTPIQPSVTPVGKEF